MNTPSREFILQTIQEHIEASEKLLLSCDRPHKTQQGLTMQHYADGLIKLLETFDNNGTYPDADLFHAHRNTLRERLAMLRDAQNESH